MVISMRSELFAVLVAVLIASAATAKDEDRTLEAIQIEGEIDVPQVLFITSDEELVNRVDYFDEGTITLRFARNGYEASALIEDFRPEIAIIDLNGLPDQGFGLLDSIAADARIPHIRVILVIAPESMGRMLQRPRHRLVVSMLEKPQVCDRIEEVVKGSMVEMAPVAGQTA